MPDYTPDYYISKFAAIPDDNWITDTYGYEDKHCALGHCGENQGGNLPGASAFTPESRALSNLFAEAKTSVPTVNDAYDDRFPQLTPKARILAALHYIKDKCQSKTSSPGKQ